MGQRIEALKEYSLVFLFVALACIIGAIIGNLCLFWMGNIGALLAYLTLGVLWGLFAGSFFGGGGDSAGIGILCWIVAFLHSFAAAYYLALVLILFV